MAETKTKRKGHWPLGKRRNNPGVDEDELAQLMAQVQEIIESQYTAGEVSYRALADKLGHDSRTIRRWVDGDDWPSKKDVRKLTKWVAKHSY